VRLTSPRMRRSRASKLYCGGYLEKGNRRAPKGCGINAAGRAGPRILSPYLEERASMVYYRMMSGKAKGPVPLRDTLVIRVPRDLTAWLDTEARRRRGTTRSDVARLILTRMMRQRQEEEDSARPRRMPGPERSTVRK
jgi:hypothetical protein